MKSRARPAPRRAGRELRASVPRSAAAWPPLPALVSAALAILLYVPCVRYGFVWDDHYLFEHQLPLVPLRDLGHLLTSDFWMITGANTGFWRPVISLSYWVDGQLSHWNPAWFHAGNLVGHGIAAAAVALLLLRLRVPAWSAALAACWFAAMPLHVESVAWVSGRTDVYSGALAIAALWLDRRDRQSGRALPGWLPLTAAALALLAKESAVLLVLLIAVAEWTEPGERRTDRWRWLLPYAGLTIAFLALHAWLVPTPPAVPDQDPAARPLVRGAAWTAFARSLAFLLPGFPHGAEPPLPLPPGPFAGPVLAGVAAHLLAVAALVALVARRSRYALAVALLWATGLPALAGTLLRGTPLYAERLFYLPSAGAALSLGLALAPVRRRPMTIGLGIAAAALVAWSGIVTLRILPVWQTDQRLFTDIVTRSPGSARGHVGLADVLSGQGRDAEAEQQYAAAERIQPRLSFIPIGRALIAFRHARWAEVVTQSDRELAVDSVNMNARLLKAAALLRLQRPAEALATLAPIRALRPGYPVLEGAYGQALLALGRTDEALGPLEHAERWTHDDADLSFALATAYVRGQRWADARRLFTETVTIDPGYYDAWLRLATTCQLAGDAAGRDAALARAAALPQASDGRVEALRRELLARP